MEKVTARMGNAVGDTVGQLLALRVSTKVEMLKMIHADTEETLTEDHMSTDRLSRRVWNTRPEFAELHTLSAELTRMINALVSA